MLPSLTFNKSYGDKSQDIANTIIKLDDGYLLAGDWGKSVGLVKTNLNGDQAWRKTYGAEGTDSARAVFDTGDGYVIAGYSSSYEGYGVYGVYLLKVDKYGDKLWYKSYSHRRNGHITDAFGRAAVAVDNGYVIVGDTNTDNNEGSDILAIKTDGEGNLIWNTTFGGNGVEHGNAIVRASDGYIIAGDTTSYGNGVNSGVSDVFLVKINAYGDLMWNKTFGGNGLDTANGIIAVDDGYVIVGSSKSFSNDSKYDVYLVKTDFSGNLVWENHYGQADDDQGKSIVAVKDGYVIAGYTSTLGNFYKDVYLLKVDLKGEPMWYRTYGGSDMDEGNCIVKAGDGFAIAGYTSTYGIYTADYCFMKIDPEAGTAPKASATVEPTAEPVATETPQAGPLSTVDLGIIIFATLATIAIAGGVLVWLYVFQKK